MANDYFKKLPEQVLGEKNKESIIDYLQKIGEILVSTKIKLSNDFCIEPLWVEAYFKSKNFNDISCLEHNEENNIPYLDVFKCHRGGVDIVLHNNNEGCLTYLIKYSFVYKGNDKKVLKSQTKLKDELNKEFKNTDGFLEILEINKIKEQKETIFMTRLGLSQYNKQEENKYFHKPLAIVRKEIEDCLIKTDGIKLNKK